MRELFNMLFMFYYMLFKGHSNSIVFVSYLSNFVC